jgi:hypothetical protein
MDASQLGPKEILKRCHVVEIEIPAAILTFDEVYNIVISSNLFYYFNY